MQEAHRYRITRTAKDRTEVVIVDNNANDKQKRPYQRSARRETEENRELLYALEFTGSVHLGMPFPGERHTRCALPRAAFHTSFQEPQIQRGSQHSRTYFEDSSLSGLTYMAKVRFARHGPRFESLNA